MSKVNFAVVDLIPASLKSIIPPELDEVLDTQASIPMENGGRLPEWFVEMASPRYLAITPKGPDECKKFQEYSAQLLQAYLKVRRMCERRNEHHHISSAFIYNSDW